MSTTTRDRSQPMLRIPRDQTPVSLVLDDGQRANAFLFVPVGTSVLSALENSSAFLPINFSDGTKLVARDSIACISIHSAYARLEDELPGEQQRVVVRLRSGHLVKGDMRWIAQPDYRRVLDHLNDRSAHIVLHDSDQVSYVSKKHVMTVEELHAEH